MNITWERLLTWWSVKCGMREIGWDAHKPLDTKPDIYNGCWLWTKWNFTNTAYWTTLPLLLYLKVEIRRRTKCQIRTKNPCKNSRHQTWHYATPNLNKFILDADFGPHFTNTAHWTFLSQLLFLKNRNNK